MKSELIVLGPFAVPHLAERRVRIHLPPHGGDGPPPLLVMFDGQNVFHDEPSFAGGWHLHRTAKKIVTRKRREPAVVGIDHGGTERIHELVPWSGGRSQGKLNHLLDWMVGFLMPLLARDFGLAPDIRHRLVGGSSLGGLAAFYAHHRNPETFGGVMAMSPSFWIGGDRMFDMVAATAKPWTSHIYLDAGAHEGGMMRGAERMAALLAQRGYGADMLRFRRDPRGKHSETDWRRRAPAALRFLFATPKRSRRA